MTESTADGNQSLRKAWWRRLAPTAGTMVAFSLLLAATTIRIADPGWLQTARVLTFDLYQRLSPRPITESPVIVVDIDEKSLAALGQWPWPRSLIGALNRMGVTRPNTPIGAKRMMKSVSFSITSWQLSQNFC